jgi:5'-3' exonuclease
LGIEEIKMGIKNLNRFLRENCNKNSIRKIHLGDCANKTVVIDTSIYLYKFASDNQLIENMYLFISVLKKYKILPIFVFDGKPPIEKKELLRQRRIDKKDAEEKYISLQHKLETENIVDKQVILLELEHLKKKFIRITDQDIQKTKELMTAYGVTYIDAPGEADKLCAYLTKTGKAWGCMSDDMDMFLYGCSFVLRNLSLMNHTVLLYDTQSILLDLEMPEDEFREIMILSGTDYNIHSKTSLEDTIHWYYQYNIYRSNLENAKPLKFYVWLMRYTQYIENFIHLLRTYQIFLFTVEENQQFQKYDELSIDFMDVKREELEQILRKEGFIFSSQKTANSQLAQMKSTGSLNKTTLKNVFTPSQYR